MRKTLLSIIISFVVLVSGYNPGADLDEIPVFLYHMVKEELEEGDSPLMVVSVDKFEEDLRYLQEKGYTAIDLHTLYEAYNRPGTELPQKPVLITFDDGYLNNYEFAYPLLERYNTRASIFMIVWSVGRDKFILNDKPINPHFTWEQAKEMLDSGLIEFGSHTFDLHNPEGLSYGYEEACGYGLGPIKGEGEEDYYNRIYGDLKKSREIMEERLGPSVGALAYPYGFYNDTVIEAVKSAGFQLAFITESQEPKNSPFEIRRIIVGENLKMEEILEK
ncbi:MAG: polysaccharide deacetylase family protein [Tissierellaceae bacterium]